MVCVSSVKIIFDNRATQADIILVKHDGLAGSDSALWLEERYHKAAVFMA